MHAFVPRLTVGLALTALAVAGCTTGQTSASNDSSGTASAADLKGKVYFLTPNPQVTRFDAYDTPNIRAALKELAPGLELVSQSANNDPAQQLQQAQAAITSGAKAIILVAPVPDQAQSVVAAAHAAGIPVIEYAYAAKNADIDYYVTVPFEPIGEQVAKLAVETLKDKKPIKLAAITGDPSFFFDTEIVKGTNKVLDPLVKSGDVQVVCENDNLQLSTENARKATEGCLERANGQIDGILAHNDSSVNGVVAALAAQNLLGKVKIFGGYDSEAGTIQHLLAGNVENDMVPPYEAMADSAAKLLVALLTKSGEETKLVNGTYDAGNKQVPTVYNENVLITPENVQAELIDKGILSKKDVCAGPALTSAFCGG